MSVLRVDDYRGRIGAHVGASSARESRRQARALLSACCRRDAGTAAGAAFAGEARSHKVVGHRRLGCKAQRSRVGSVAGVLGFVSLSPTYGSDGWGGILTSPCLHTRTDPPVGASLARESRRPARAPLSACRQRHAGTAACAAFAGKARSDRLAGLRRLGCKARHAQVGIRPRSLGFIAFSPTYGNDGQGARAPKEAAA